MLCTSPWARFELTTFVVIGTDCIGSCKSDYHTITTTAATYCKTCAPSFFNSVDIAITNFVTWVYFIYSDNRYRRVESSILCSHKNYRREWKSSLLPCQRFIHYKYWCLNTCQCTDWSVKLYRSWHGHPSICNSPTVFSEYIK